MSPRDFVAEKTILTTNRLKLREFTNADAAFILELLNDSAFIRFIGDRNVRTLDDAGNYLNTGPIDSYKRHGFGLYLVQLKKTKTPIGMCGLLKRDVLDHVDIGFAFLPDYREQGYGLEAASAVLAHAHDNLKLKRILAITNPDNESSIKLLEKLGFHFERMMKLSENGDEVKLFGKSDTL
jgi:ribosomal-protein-alanine N-acetyltransferase